MLEDTRYRDASQVVSREARKQAYDRHHNILMVDQLWLWLIKGENDQEPDTIISSFPGRKGAHRESKPVDDIQRAVLTERCRRSIFKSEDLVSRILTLCCKTLDRHQKFESIQFLDMFESALGHAVRLPSTHTYRCTYSYVYNY